MTSCETAPDRVLVQDEFSRVRGLHLPHCQTKLHGPRFPRCCSAFKLRYFLANFGANALHELLAPCIRVGIASTGLGLTRTTPSCAVNCTYILSKMWGTVPPPLALYLSHVCCCPCCFGPRDLFALSLLGLVCSVIFRLPYILAAAQGVRALPYLSKLQLSMSTHIEV